MALILLAAAMLIVAPLLGYMASGLTTTRGVYDVKAAELYAADAGLMDAQWQIKSGNVGTLTTPVLYNKYDFAHQWAYDVKQAGNPVQINGKNVQVTIKNAWIPKDLTMPVTDAQIAQSQSILTTGKLIVTGANVQSNIATAGGDKVSQYKLEFTYFYKPGDETSPNSGLKVDTLGVWLPAGFAYYSDATLKSSLEQAGQKYFSIPSPQAWASGEAVRWSFPSVKFSDFPVSDDGVKKILDLTFYYKPAQDKAEMIPQAIGWIKSSGVADIPYSWDISNMIYKIDATAGSTTVESYVARAQTQILADTTGGDYCVTGGSLMNDSNLYDNQRDSVKSSSSNSIQARPQGDTSSNKIPSDADILFARLYWSGWLNQSRSSGTVTNLDDFSLWTQTGSNWSGSGSSQPFSGKYISGADSTRYLKLSNSLNLNGVAAGKARLTWTQTSDPYAPLTNTPTWSLGNAWNLTGSPSYYCARTSSTPNNDTNPNRNLTSDPMNLSSYGSSGSLVITWQHTVTGSGSSLNGSDGLDFAYSINNGAWVSSQVFRGDNFGGSWMDGTLSINYSSPITSLRIRFSAKGTSDSSRYVAVRNVAVGVPHTEIDGLQFSFWDGFNWSAPQTLTSPYTIPANYLVSNFKIGLYLEGFSGNGEKLYVDNVNINIDDGSAIADNRINFKVNSGPPQTLVANQADPQQVISKGVINSNGQPEGYYYACQKDVTNLVRQYSDGANWSADPKVNGSGAGTYTVSPLGGDILADTKNPDGSWGASAYAGWSLVIVYTSQQTRGNYLKLYDWNDWTDRFSVPAKDPHNTSQPYQFQVPVGGFILPQQEADETDAAKLTAFVGEGDPQLTGDYLALIDQADPSEHKLWDGVTLPDGSDSVSNPNNVWNSQSAEFPGDAGVDIDTFHIPWNNPTTLQENDTSAKIKFYTNGDGFVLIYMLVSFRSLPSTGGPLAYFVK
jgi:hypothetical protein